MGQGAQTVNEALRYIRTPEIDIDNGNGTTVDLTLMVPTTAITIQSMSVVYTDATTGTVAAATIKVGTTVGGAEIVAATALTNSATVGTRQALTLASSSVASGTPIIARHTGIAATAAGKYFVQMAYVVDA